MENSSWAEVFCGENGPLQNRDHPPLRFSERVYKIIEAQFMQHNVHGDGRVHIREDMKTTDEDKRQRNGSNLFWSEDITSSNLPGVAAIAEHGTRR